MTGKILAGTLALLLFSSASLGMGTGTISAETHNGVAQQPLTYAATLLMPRGGSKVAGAVALMGSVHSSGASKGGSNSSNTNTAGTAGAGNMAVALILSGLKPGSKNDARISQGTCAATLSSNSSTSTTFQLPSLVALASGDAMVITTITTTQTFASGFVVNVYAPGTTTSLACGVLHRPGMVVYLKPDMGGKASGVALITMPVNVMGSKMIKGTEVVVYATGLQPKVVHPNHIHAGPCGTPSHIMYPLIDLLADSAGRAVEGTGLTDLLPKTALSLHIHQNTMAPDACGDIASAAKGTGM